MESLPSREGPTTPKTHARTASKFVSPVSLPIRSDEDPITPPQPAAQSPGLKPSPRRSFYQIRAVPVAKDEATEEPALPSAEAHDPGLIFDDGDDRLPPPEASPTFRPNLEADVLAISSPALSPGAAAELDESAYDDGLDYSFQLVNGRRRSAMSSPGFEPHSRRSSDPLSVSGLSMADTVGSHYPTPIPAQLMRPPRLSKKPNQRKSSLPIEDMPVPPQWGPSPLEDEVPYVESMGSTTGTLSMAFSMSQLGLGNDDEPHASDVDSDQATIMSDDRDELDASYNEEGDANDHGPNAGSSKKRRSWLPNMFKRKSQMPDVEKDEMGEKFDAKEANTLLAQMAVLDNDVAFSKLDPEAIQRHSQMFDAGGVHSGIVPHSGGPTSLIEELEIRKAGKKIQRQVFSREVRETERQRAEDAQAAKAFHPADLVYNTQPTLMQMQHMAQVDYDTRVQWHTRAINRHYINEHAGETLAQRRARLKQDKMRVKEATGAQQETLAQRRQRLKKQKETAAIKKVDTDLNNFEHDVVPMDPLLDETTLETQELTDHTNHAISAI